MAISGSTPFSLSAWRFIRCLLDPFPIPQVYFPTNQPTNHPTTQPLFTRQKHNKSTTYRGYFCTVWLFVIFWVKKKQSKNFYSISQFFFLHMLTPSSALTAKNKRVETHLSHRQVCGDWRWADDCSRKKLKPTKDDISGLSFQRIMRACMAFYLYQCLCAFIELHSLFTIWYRTVFHFKSVSGNISHF